LGLGLRYVLAPLTGTNFPFLTIWIAVIFAVWYCGTGPAIVTALSGFFGVWYWFLAPPRSFVLQNPKVESARLVAFLVVSSFVIALGESQRRSRARLESYIAEQSRAERQLRELQRGLHEAQRLAKMGSWSWDPESDTVTWTEGLYRIYGRDPSLPAPTYAEMPSRYAPESWRRLKAAVETALRTGEGYQLELEMIRIDGTTVSVITHAEAEKDSSGRVVRLYGSIQDISDIKRADETLRQRDERLRIAQKAARSGSFEFNFKSKSLIASPELEEIYGLAPGAGSGDVERWKDLIHPEDVARRQQTLLETLASGSPEYQAEFRIVRPDRSVRWMESRALVFYDADKNAERIVGVNTDITERKQSEDQLRAGEERLRFMAERARAGFWDWDIASGRLEWSPLCKQLFGIPLHEEMSYERALLAVHPEDRELTDRVSRAYLASGGGPDFEMEYRVLWPDGTIRWIHAQGSASFEDGRAQRMAGIVLDVTDRKRSQEELRKNEERLRMAHMAAHSGAWEVDLVSKEIMWSPEMQALWGLVPGTTSDPRTQISHMLYAEDQPVVDQALQDALAGRGYHLEFRIHRADGALRWMESFGEVIYDEDGRPVRMVGVAIDITERRQGQEALRKNEERLRLAHQAGHSGAWEVDLLTREIFWSPELQLLWGLTPGTSGNIRETIWNMILAEDHAKLEQALAQVFETGTHAYHNEYRMMRADGALRWNEAFGEVIRDGAGKPVRVVGVTVDITERKLGEEALRSSHLELERKVEARTAELAASLARLEDEVEVRKQAEEALQGLSARLLRVQDEERRRVARDLHDSTGQTLAALKMTVANLESLVRHIPQAPPLIQELNILANDAIKDIRTTSHLLHPPLLDEVGFRSAAQWYVDELAKRSGVNAELELALPPGRLTKAAELAFFRVLQESLSNVIRHSGSGTVDVRLHADGENAVLTIQDHGRGIPEPTLTRFNETGTGVGVGLGGMKQRIRELGGQLRISSNGKGACIIATLPANHGGRPPADQPPDRPIRSDQDSPAA
jgi:PAS domain S-box-containing protein